MIAVGSTSTSVFLKYVSLMKSGIRNIYFNVTVAVPIIVFLNDDYCFLLLTND